MWELDHKKAEKLRIAAFELWCWRRLLRVPWTTGRTNQSILKEINPEYSLERLMLKLKLQYFAHLMRTADSLKKQNKTKKPPKSTNDWRKEENRVTEDKIFDGITNSRDMNLSKFRQMVKDREVWCAIVHGLAKSWTWLSNWATTNNVINFVTQLLLLQVCIYV